MTFKRRVTGWLAWSATLLIYASTLLLLGLLRGRRGRSAPADCSRPLRLLITGRFDSRNWARAHLVPLARATCVGAIDAVVDGPADFDPKVRCIAPPRWLRTLLGRAASKAIMMARVAAVRRPDVVMGYHIFPGAITALLVARAVGARCVYQMTAGPVEIVGGGVGTENALLSRLPRPSELLEGLAARICRQFDTVVVRGRGAREFVLGRCAAHRVAIVPGSVHPSDAPQYDEPRIYDVVYAGRLNPIKQPEHFIRVIAELCRMRPQVRAAVVGNGPLLKSLRAEAAELGVLDRIEFLGHVENVQSVLHRTRVFVLTSRSEGLSIALAEAMTAGAVPVVAAVGDLRDLVRDGESGWCVRPGDFPEYARRILSLLEDPKVWRRCSAAARTRAIENNSLASVVMRWNACLMAVVSPDGGSGLHHTGLDVGNFVASEEGLWERRLFQLWQRAPRWIKSAAGVPLSVISPRYLLGPRFARELRFVQAAGQWSPDCIREYQLERLRSICSLACARSEYYRQRFRDVGFEPQDLREVEDLQHLPFLDRDTLRSSAAALCTRPLNSRGIEYVSTGGTGGAPIHFYIGAGRSAIEYAYLVASWQRAGFRLGTPMGVFRGRIVTKDASGLRHEYDPVLRHHHYSNFHMSDENMARYIEHLREIGPCFLHVYPSAAAVLARFISRSGMRPPANVLGIIAESETVYPEQRAFIESVFGCRCFTCYGHSEKVVLAAECEHSTDYHVWPTYGYFELVDSEGRQVCTPGRRGEIVGTGFINSVTPFIRYRTGDYATYVADRCAGCGRAHMLIRDVGGHRIQEVLVASDGSLISMAAINMHDDTFTHVRSFQFRQEAPGKVLLRIVPCAGFGEEDRRRILRNLGQKLNGAVDLEIALAGSIELSPRGKAIYVDQRLAVPPLGTVSVR